MKRSFTYYQRGQKYFTKFIVNFKNRLKLFPLFYHDIKFFNIEPTSI